MFSDKIYIISGTSSGIGKACAQGLLNSDSIVIGLDKNLASLSHDRYFHYVIDIVDEEVVANTIGDITSKYSRIEGLVNCAGIYARSKPFYELSSNEWNSAIAVNLTSIFTLSNMFQSI
ncbi:MAG: SDR family NAD(P)-dependent oxidoreductase [Clostridiaceae bacterium]|nr:SDR family NAD(P)-dependent oxidoreductase [Clostridiaceae bacterium]